MSDFKKSQHNFELCTRSKFPAFFMVETVNACNAKCPMCPKSKHNNTGNFEISSWLFEKFVDEIASHVQDIKSVGVYWCGEPTLDPNLFKRIKCLKDSGIECVSISTNAELLTEEFSTKLIYSGIDDVRISLESINKETYEKIRVGLKFEDVLENTLRFINLRNELEKNIVLHIRSVELDENRDELQEWTNFWKGKLSKNDKLEIMPCHNWGSKFACENTSKEACISPFTTMIIDINGMVPLCCLDSEEEVVLGDFKKNTISEIWNGEKISMIRKLHKTGQRDEIEICRYCTAWQKEPQRLI